MEAYRRLNRRQQKYVDALVLCGTGSEAVRRAGLKRRDGRPIQRPKQLAWRLNRNPLIEQAYQECKAQAAAAWQDRVQRWLVEQDRIATFDFRTLFDENSQLLSVADWPDGAAAAIAGLDVEALYEFEGKERVRIGDIRKFKMWNKNEAIRTLLQFVGKLPERHELTGKDGGPIKVARSADDLTDEQLAAIASAGRPAPAEPEEGTS